MGCVNQVASQTLQHGVWAASQYFNSLNATEMDEVNCY